MSFETSPAIRKKLLSRLYRDSVTVGTTKDVARRFGMTKDVDCASCGEHLSLVDAIDFGEGIWYCDECLPAMVTGKTMDLRIGPPPGKTLMDIFTTPVELGISPRGLGLPRPSAEEGMIVLDSYSEIDGVGSVGDEDPLIV